MRGCCYTLPHVCIDTLNIIYYGGSFLDLIRIASPDTLQILFHEACSGGISDLILHARVCCILLPPTLRQNWKRAPHMIRSTPDKSPSPVPDHPNGAVHVVASHYQSSFIFD